MSDDKAATDYTLAELCTVACAEAWRNDGEVQASGFGFPPRIGACLAKYTFNPELQITDGEAFFVSETAPLGKRPPGYQVKYSGYAPYARTFDIVYTGKRHALTGPVQIDRYGQSNLCAIGDPKKPKAALQGMRGFPGNTVNHINSMFVPVHGKRVFVEGEVDVVSGAGYNPARFTDGRKMDYVDLRLIVTNLCVMDFGGPNRQIRVVSLHPGVTFEQVQAETGFPLAGADCTKVTPPPTEAQLKLIRDVIDPSNLRATTFKDNPPGDPRVAK
jgi:glutaconate CoA-transferase subunit B